MPYEIDRIELPAEFLAAWQAAGSHINHISQGSVAWLRAHLHQPIAEHLSFRLGNQLFFVFVHVPGVMEPTEREQRLLRIVSEEAKGFRCIMPMHREGHRFSPLLSGWSLIDADTGEQLVPPDLVSDEPIEMTDWEVHDFGVQVVRAHLEQQGKQLLSWQPSPHINPSIFFMDGETRCWVVVRTARYPAEHAQRPASLAEFDRFLRNRTRAVGYFASVVAASGDDSIEGSRQRLLRGHALTAKFTGLEPV